MKHPKNNDKLRTLLVRQGIFTLVLLYVTATALVAAASTALSILLDAPDIHSLQFERSAAPGLMTDFATRFLMLYGFEDTTDVGTLTLADLGYRSFAAVFSVIAPALLFGALVFKVLQPKSVAVFRDRIWLDVERSQLVSSFYIASRLQAYAVTWTISARLFKKVESTFDHAETFPLVTRLVDDASERGPHAVPFPQMPIKFFVDVRICRDQASFESSLIAENEIVILVVDDAVKRVAFNGTQVQPHREDEFLEVLVVISGHFPESQSDFRELGRYDLFDDVTFDPDPGFTPGKLDRKKNTYKMKWRKTY